MAAGRLADLPFYIDHSPAISVLELRAKVRRMQPAVVALVGITIYPLVVPRGDKQSPGPGPKPELIEGARLYVVPNPSGLNASFPGFDAKLAWFRGLASYAGVASATAS